MADVDMQQASSASSTTPDWLDGLLQKLLDEKFVDFLDDFTTEHCDEFFSVRAEVQVEHIRLTPRVLKARSCFINFFKVHPFQSHWFQISTCTPLRLGRGRAHSQAD